MLFSDPTMGPHGYDECIAEPPFDDVPVVDPLDFMEVFRAVVEGNKEGRVDLVNGGFVIYLMMIPGTTTERIDLFDFVKERLRSLGYEGAAERLGPTFLLRVRCKHGYSIVENIMSSVKPDFEEHLGASGHAAYAKAIADACAEQGIYLNDQNGHSQWLLDDRGDDDPIDSAVTQAFRDTVQEKIDREAEAFRERIDRFTDSWKEE